MRSYSRKREGRGTERCRTWPVLTGCDTCMPRPPRHTSTQDFTSSHAVPLAARPRTRTGSVMGMRLCRRRSGFRLWVAARAHPLCLGGTWSRPPSFRMVILESSLGLAGRMSSVFRPSSVSGRLPARQAERCEARQIAASQLIRHAPCRECCRRGLQYWSWEAGGERGIRTLGRGVTPTRDFQSRRFNHSRISPFSFGGVRPAPRSLRGVPRARAQDLAERVGFEPTVPFGYNGFRDRPIQPLSHLSARPAVAETASDSNPGGSCGGPAQSRRP